MSRAAGTTSIRAIGPDDADVVAALAAYEGPSDRNALLNDPNTIMLVAFADDAAVGFALAHDLPRRHGHARALFVYEVDVAESHRRQGVARALLERLGEIARERGIGEGFVLTEPDNDAANRLYAAAGGVRSEVVMWDFSYADD
jgi:aminoglycoside 3-N-acetyltransferase I